MLQSFQVVLLLSLAASALFWAMPASWAGQKRGLLLALSTGLIFVFSPKALFTALAVTLLALGLHALMARLPSARRHPSLLWLVFVPMVVGPLVPPGRLFPFVDGNPLGPIAAAPALLGLSFYSLKLYGSLREGLKQGRLGLGPLLGCVLFYPSFTAGPIDVASTFADEAFRREIDLQLYLRGLLRIGVGAVKLLIFSAYLSNTLLPAWTGLGADGAIDWSTVRAPAAYLYALLKFAALYLNFAGYTDVAVGTGWLFNIRLSENFRLPLLAHSIQDFWQRWHLSLSRFITKYLYLPMVRATGRPALSIAAAFTIIGLWHQATWNYLVWGLGHGAALGLFLVIVGEKRKVRRELTPKLVAWRVAGVAATLSYVSVLSTFANLPSLGSGVAFLRALAGLGGRLP